jgi:hypothetical protein
VLHVSSVRVVLRSHRLEATACCSVKHLFAEMDSSTPMMSNPSPATTFAHVAAHANLEQRRPALRVPLHMMKARPRARRVDRDVLAGKLEVQRQGSALDVPLRLTPGMQCPLAPCPLGRFTAAQGSVLSSKLQCRGRMFHSSRFDLRQFL